MNFDALWQGVLATLNSPAGYTLASALIIYIWHKLAQKFKWDEERWNGVVISAFNAAEKSGALGNGKLGIAMNAFISEHARMYGHEPSAKDIADAAADFARLAWANKPQVVTDNVSANSNNGSK